MYNNSIEQRNNKKYISLRQKGQSHHTWSSKNWYLIETMENFQSVFFYMIEINDMKKKCLLNENKQILKAKLTWSNKLIVILRNGQCIEDTSTNIVQTSKLL